MKKWLVLILVLFIWSAAGFLILQGIAECLRCLHAIKHNKWPERMVDVEETEDKLLKEMEKREHELEHIMHLDTEDANKEVAK